MDKTRLDGDIDLRTWVEDKLQEGKQPETLAWDCEDELI